MEKCVDELACMRECDLVGMRLASSRMGWQRKKKYLIHKSKQMFNNEIKSLAENCFDTLKQMGEIHFCSSSTDFLFGRRCRRRRRSNRSSFVYCIFEVGGSSWTDKTIPDESINFICDAYTYTYTHPHPHPWRLNRRPLCESYKMWLNE